MAFTKTVSFVNNTSSVNDGLIYITVQDNDAAVGPFNVFISIGSPSDANYYQTTDPTPEIVLSEGGIGAFSVAIPIISGEYESGTYTVTIEIDGEETSTGTYNYIPEVLPGSNESELAVLTTSVRCNNGKIYAQDNTSNTGYFLASPPRALTISYPSGSGIDDVTTTATTSNAEIGTTNGVYTVTLEVFRQKLPVTSNTITFLINEAISTEVDVTVNCLFDLLKLKCLFFEFVRNYVEQEKYGIICDSEETYKAMEKLKAAIFILGNCTEEDGLCKVNQILKELYDQCLLSITRCDSRYTTCEDCV